jgi:uncharacterized membrane protein
MNVIGLIKSFLSSIQKVVGDFLYFCNKMISCIFNNKSLQKRRRLQTLIRISLIVFLIASGIIIIMYILTINNILGIAIIEGDAMPTTIYIAVSTKKRSLDIK